jgi:prolyl oligopeptidase
MRRSMLETADAFDFLERADDPRTIEWSAGQTARARAYLDGLPKRRELVKRFDALLQIEVLGLPVARGGRVFFLRRRSGEAQFVLAAREGSADRVLFNPEDLDPSGLTALDWWMPSAAGRYVALGLSRGGDERSVLHVLDVAAGRLLDERIPHARHSSVAWLPDEGAFYYTRYPADSNYGARAYFHVLGKDHETDRLVFGEGRAPEDTLGLELSPDGRRLVATAFSGLRRSELYLCDRQAGDAFVPLVEGSDALYFAMPALDRIVIRTNEGAPRYRIFETGYDAPARAAWREVVPERDDVLDGFAVTRGGLVMHYLHDVRSRVVVRRESGAESELSDRGCVVGLSADADSNEAFVLRTDFVEPPFVERIAFEASGVRSQEWARVAVPFDAAKYAVRQEWFASKDGTRVPMFVVTRAGLARDGSAPALLHGYGGFNVSLLPAFTPAAIPWLDAGGVFAVANLRGGGEFGEEWHRAGTLGRKQNVFDDFIAAAEYLGSSGIADPARIGIFGGSNGGLLTAACLTQRPELFAAVGSAVPLTDMLRYHRFSIARLWIAEYGDPDVPADARTLRAYSPYHNVRDGTAYPPTYLFAAESDSRVDPMHARKFGARLQEATRGTAPILVFVEPDAGHGFGKPRRKQVEEFADRWAFFFEALGVR